ncbi:MAG: prolipoprotein diacylglyceryl transferase [Candidatus Brocadiaceae bacterium]|nr:prolipoprotein diacylglyceryl transferase [Candidatus Brocadiaceae bacterium]
MRKILFEIPLPVIQKSIPVYAYGFMLMVAFFFAILIARWRAKKEGVAPDKITDLGIYLVCAGIVGARVFFVLQFFHEYKNDLLGIFKVYEGGLVYFGGLFAAIITLFVYAKKNHLPVLKIIDIVAPSTALGLAIGRIGCFMNGCCFGKVALHLPWGICFPKTYDKTGMVDGSPAFLYQCNQGLIHLSDVKTLPVHPAQLYAFLSNLALFFILNLFFAYRKKNGEVVLLFGMLYAVIRYSMESLRGDNPLYFNLLTIAQIISIIVFIISSFLFVLLRFKADSGAFPGKRWASEI